MRYLSVDIETTGLSPSNHQIIEFAAVLEDTSNNTPVDKLPCWVTYFDHPQLLCDPYCVANFKLSEIISKTLAIKKGATPGNIVNTDSFAKAFLTWVTGLGLLAAGQRLTFAGKNVGAFDIQFLRRLYDFDRLIPYNHRYLDPAVLYVSEEDAALPDMSECLKRAGLHYPVAHTALADARDVIRLFRTRGCVTTKRLFCDSN